MEGIINLGLGLLYGSLAIIGAIAIYPDSVGYVLFALVTMIITVSSEEVIEPTDRDDIIRDVNNLEACEIRQYQIVVTFATTAGISLLAFVTGLSATLAAMYTDSVFLPVVIAVGYPVIDRDLSKREPKISIIAFGFRLAVEGYKYLQGSRHASNHKLPEKPPERREEGQGKALDIDEVGDTAIKSGSVF